MSDQSLKRLVATLVAGLVVVIGLGSVLGSRAVADDLADRSSRALDAAGLGDVRVDFRGREARLDGGNDLEARRAVSLVGALPGVRRVEADRPADAVIDGVSRFELDRSGDDVEISGVVQTPDDAAAIKVAAATALRTTVTGDVRVSPDVRAAGWVTDLPQVLELVAGVDRLDLEISGDGTVELGGEVDTTSTRARIVRQVTAALPDLDLVDGLRVRPPSGRGD